jgi:hypothetical protein
MNNSYCPQKSIFKLYGYNAKTQRFSFEYKDVSYTMKCEADTCVLKSFTDESGKSIARTSKAFKKLVGIQDNSGLANELRKMATFAANYLRNL